MVQTETGGGFGGKEEYPSMIAAHAALLAWKSGRPVKTDLRSRRRHGRDHQAASLAHPASHGGHARRQTARDGHRFHHRRRRVRDALAGGAFARHHPRGGSVRRAPTCAFAAARWPPTLRRTARFAASALRRASSRSSAIWTRSPRPLGSRRKNCAAATSCARARPLPPGRWSAKTSTWTRCSTARSRLSDYHAKRERFARENPHGARSRRGIGFAAFLHGAGFTGSGEDYLASVVGVEATREGRVRVLAASTEIGQGTNTIFSQIAADTLGHRITSRSKSRSRTRRDVPNSGPTVASRTCMIVGKLVESAALGAEATLLQHRLLGEATAPSFARRVPCLHREDSARCGIRRVRSRRRNLLGRQHVSGRRVRRLRVGGLRRGGLRRHD